MAGSHSKVVDETERRIADDIRVRLYDIEDRIKKLTQEQAQLTYLRDKILKLCQRCQGGGTICESRTDDDAPFYQPCPTCKGKGHGRD